MARPWITSRAVQSVPRRPWWAWLCAGGALLLLVRPVPDWPLSDPVAATWVASIVALVGTGWWLMGGLAQRGNGALMLVLAIETSATSLRDVGVGPWAFVGSQLYPVSGLLLVLLLLRWPRGGLQSRSQVVFIAVAAVGAPLLQLADDLAWDPAWSGYTGPALWPTVQQDEGLSDVLHRLSQGFQLLLLVVAAVLVVSRTIRASRPERRELIPVLLAAAAFTVSASADAVAAATGWVSSTPVVASNVAFLAVPLGVVVSATVRRLQRALAVETLVRPLHLAEPESLRTVLARALGDRDLTLALWLTEQAGYVDVLGRPAEAEAPGRHVVEVTGSDGTPVARLGVDPRLVASADLVESVSRAAGLALENARLHVDLQARLREGAVTHEQLTRAQGVERSLSRLVPTGLADRLRADPAAVTRTARLTVTVLMSDIRGYSGIAEVTTPAQLAQQLDEHRRAMNDIILAEQGTVMQYVGDAVLAVFGAPSPQVDHAARALRAAAGMHRGQQKLDQDWAARDRRPFGLGIGLSTGEVAAAFLGSEERIEYTVVGDTVNLAARLTDAARPAGTTLASAATMHGADSVWDAEALAPMQVKGRVSSVSAYRIRMLDDAMSGRPTGAEPPDTPQTRETHHPV